MRRNDPVLGSMLFMGDRLKYWEGKARFDPESGKEIDIFVDASETEDLASQHRFYEEVSSRWEALLGKIKSAVAERVGAAPELSLASIHIPRGQLDTASWELTFSVPEGAEFVTVRMKGKEPTEVAGIVNARFLSDDTLTAPSGHGRC